MASRRPERNRDRRSRRRGGGWLAIAALLVNTLLPAALLLGAGPAPDRTALVFCGAISAPSPSDERAPGQHPATVSHCVLCLTVPIGLTPADTGQLPPPVPEETAVLVAVVGGAPRSAPLCAALPRGPPAAA